MLFRLPVLPLLLFGAGSFVSTVGAAEDKPCTAHHDGKYYDLNRVQSTDDYKLSSPENLEIVLSACKSVSQETWGLKGIDDPANVAGFVRRGHGDFSLGRTNTTLSFHSRSKHPHLAFTGGSKCIDSAGNAIDNLRGSSEIEFVCDPGAGRGQPRLVAQLPAGPDDKACAWVFEWRTAAACPTSEGITFGGFIWGLFISIILLLILYVVVGTIYNHFVLNLQGTDALPRFSVAGMIHHGRDALEMASDWAATYGRGPQYGGRYDALPTDREGGAGFTLPSSADSNSAFVRTRKEPVTNPASHQTQVMAPPAQGGGGVQMPAPAPAPASVSAVNAAGSGLNPASHQAQLMAGMPVPQLSRSTGSGPPPPAPIRVPAPELVVAESEAPSFAVGDDDVDEEESGGIKL
ncbi:unnamed protein product [Mycena citricolor]|uniref:Autophagy-related protein 27 n=1 Tax=Mycena citricolor TaxID=2018698 RepID=A0AAD2Q5P5_9AGAR|nr:unnamed protein product [Mycena citricolor]